jgi:murein DD-endopeptidase MepM/ murein hydrolase activator NlpD
MRIANIVVGIVLTFAAGGGASAEPFSFDPPGKVVPNSGTGSTDATVFAPGIRFPLEEGPAFASSQVHGFGGSVKGGSQCHHDNYVFPWHDNFCETRSRATGACPLGKGHQGQDIRPRTCRKDAHFAVAVENGEISDIGSFTVALLGDSGTLYRYLHMNMDRLQVREGDRVTAGQRLGFVSNFFGGTPTTIHLHFEILKNSPTRGFQHVPPYMSLVRAFERLQGP